METKKQKLTPENITDKRLQVSQNELDIKKNLNNVVNWEMLIKNGYVDEEARLNIRKQINILENLEAKYKKGLHKKEYLEAIEKAIDDNLKLQGTIKKMKKELREGFEEIPALLANSTELNKKEK